MKIIDGRVLGKTEVRSELSLLFTPPVWYLGCNRAGRITTVTPDIISIRPALNLSSGILVSDGVDGDGCYTIVWPVLPAGGSMAAKMVAAGLI